MADKSTSPPPAYFLSLSLENVRSFGAKQTISFAREDGRPAQWTIILGDNGVGKTTVLKSLASSLPLSDFSEDRDQAQGFQNNALLYKWQAIRHDGIKHGIIDVSITVGNRLTAKLAGISKAVLGSITLETIITHLSHKYPAYGLNISPVNISGLQGYGYGAGRTTGNSTLSETPEADDFCASLFNDRADLLNPEEWFLQADYRIKSDDHSLTKQNFKLLRQALINVLDEVTDLKVSPVAPGGNPRQGLQFLTPYGWVRLRDMSLGYQTLVVWLTDLASKLFIRYPDSKNPLEEPAIVLIDEIDLHLHPSWQRKLIGFLSNIFKNTQFIATAHSPLVVQAAGDVQANVVLLKREGDETVVVQDLPDVRRWRIEQILSSELFDDTPPLSPQTEADLTYRNKLLLKKRLTAAEKADLTRLTADLTGQPIGATRPERRAESLLAQLAQNLGEQDLLP